MQFTEDLLHAVTISNIAGYMEDSEIIFVPDDEHLTHTICDIVNEWYRDRVWETMDIFTFAYDRLLDIYSVNNDKEEEIHE